MKDWKRWIEPCKTICLVLLVALSFVLTGYLWYSAPSYEENREEDYIQPPAIGNQKDNDKTLPQLTGPLSMVAHRSGQHLLLSVDDRLYTQLSSQVQQIALSQFQLFQPSPEDWNLVYQQAQSLEFQFLQNRSVGQLDSFFQKTILRDQSLLNQRTISRLFLLADTKSNHVWVWFVDDQHQQVIRAMVENLSVSSLNQLIAQVTPTTHIRLALLPANEKAPWDKANKDLPFSRMLYLPAQEVQLPAFDYRLQPIDLNTMKLWLFKDPYVSPIQLNNDEQLYMYNGPDQSLDQILTYHKKHNSMTYTSSPLPTEEPKALTREEINQINQFIERHRGWTGNYLLDQLRTENNTTEYLFRLFLFGYPLYWKGEQPGVHLSTIQFQVTDNSVSKYARSLYYLEGKPQSEQKQTLPSAKELLSELKERKISLMQIQRIYPAYLSSLQKKGSSQLAHFTPVWAVQTLDGHVEMIAAPLQRR